MIYVRQYSNGTYYRFKTNITVNGKETGEKAIQLVLINDNQIEILQRMFTDSPDTGDSVLRTWKGKYYIQRGVSLKHETFDTVLQILEHAQNLRTS